MVTQVTALRLREMASIEQQKRLRDPIAVFTDNEGYMYVTDYGSHRIQIYKKEAHALEPFEISDPLRQSLQGNCHHNRYVFLMRQNH